MASTVKNNNQGGKRPGQKYKSLLVWHYLQKQTDEDHAVKTMEIKDFLKQYGITADRHSISRDICALQDIYETGIEKDLDKNDRFKYQVVYDASAKGYKLASRPYTFKDLRLLAECVHASKFISQAQEKRLLKAVEEMCSSHQIEELKSEVYLVGRNRTSNDQIMKSLQAINQAIRGDRKISFQYMKYTLNDRSTQVAKKGGKAYIRSPFKLLINDGNYYLLAYDGEEGKIKTYRVDRMSGVKVEKEHREGQKLFGEIDIKTYTQRVFSMFSGENKFVSIRFENGLLDTAIERFGNGAEVFYRPEGKEHFVVSANVEVSDQFYAWVCGFRSRAVITNPKDVVRGMKEFVSSVYGNYESE